jgi:hypothetical protein
MLRSFGLPDDSWLENMRRARYDAEVAERGLFAPECEKKAGVWLQWEDIEDMNRVLSACH